VPNTDEDSLAARGKNKLPQTLHEGQRTQADVEVRWSSVERKRKRKELKMSAARFE
jgi:hypothetical protein